MGRYVSMFRYTADAAAGMIKNPSDREAAARHLIERMGGRLDGFYWMMGPWDGLAIYEVPDRTTAVAISVAVTSSGILERNETHELLDSGEALRALERANAAAAAYEPPSRGVWHEGYDALGGPA